MTGLDWALVPAGVFLGAASQRITGIGFTLVAAPILILAIGPEAGVTVCLAGNGLLAFIIFCAAWREVAWLKAGVIFVGITIGSLAGSFLMMSLRMPVMLTTIGFLIVAATGSTVLGYRPRMVRGRGGAVVSGAISGFMNVLSGAGGPLIAVHAMTERWKHSVFIGTTQILFFVGNLLALVLRGPMRIEPSVWAVVGPAALAGGVAGQIALRRLDEKLAKRAVVIFSILGGLSMIAKGLLGR